MGVWEYGSEDFVNILYHIYAFLYVLANNFLPSSLSFGQKKAALVVGTAFFLIYQK